jgi:hypothetical protein
MRKNRAFTLVELITTIAIVMVALVLLVAITLPIVFSRPPGHTRGPNNLTHLRGIGQGMILFSQGNNGYYPGLTREGELADDWRGGVVFGDNSITFMTTCVTATRYLKSIAHDVGSIDNTKDDLFTPEGSADSFMVRD